MFAAVQAKSSYIALHIYPIYLHPELLAETSETLKSRMQGKSCFHVKKLDQAANNGVAQLLQAAFQTLQSQPLPRRLKARLGENPERFIQQPRSVAPPPPHR